MYPPGIAGAYAQGSLYPSTKTLTHSANSTKALQVFCVASKYFADLAKTSRLHAIGTFWLGTAGDSRRWKQARHQYAAYEYLRGVDAVYDRVVWDEEVAQEYECTDDDCHCLLGLLLAFFGCVESGG